MKVAVIADIHGNMDALESVLADSDTLGVKEIISLGDNIGYGAQPNQVVACLRSRKIVSVMGNHELAVVHPHYLKWFNPQARRALEATVAMLSESTVAYIQDLKRSLVAHTCRFVHGFPPHSPTLYLFQVRERRVLNVMSTMAETICFTGHTHVLEQVAFDGHRLRRADLQRGVLHLDPQYKYILNIGSVGQPRDGDNHAKYVIWNSVSGSVDVRYVPYDIAAAVGKIRDAGLPGIYADRLW